MPTSRILRRIAAVVLAASARLASGKRTTLAASKAYKNFLWEFMNSASCDRGSGRVLLFDVGSNDGRFLTHDLRIESLMPMVCNGSLHVAAFLIEPQRRWQSHLTRMAIELKRKLAPSLDINVVPFAAWTHNETVRLRSARNSQESRIEPANLSAQAAPSRSTTAPDVDLPSLYNVQAIDLADFVLRALRPSDIALLKIDVEGAEYAILPRLLTSGVLCRMSHLLVEWHLKQVSESDRLACLALKLALPLMLQRGCTTPPQLMQEEVCKLTLEPWTWPARSTHQSCAFEPFVWTVSRNQRRGVGAWPPRGGHRAHGARQLHSARGDAQVERQRLIERDQAQVPARRGDAN